MKKKISILVGLIIALFGMFLAYGWRISADYRVDSLMTALESGEDVTGKTVDVKATSVNDNTLLGYIFYTKNELVFVNPEDQGIRKGFSGKVKIKEAKKVLGSWVIFYELEK